MSPETAASFARIMATWENVAWEFSHAAPNSAASQAAERLALAIANAKNEALRLRNLLIALSPPEASKKP